MSLAEDVLLRSLEEKLLKPEVRGSPDEVGYLLADEFIEFGSSGRVYDKRQIIAALQQEMPDPTTRISLVDFGGQGERPRVGRGHGSHERITLCGSRGKVRAIKAF